MIKRIVTLAVLAALAAQAAHAGQVLMVVDDPAQMGPGDLALKANFIDMGHTVKVVDDGACSSADATGCALVWVCDSVEPDKVGTKFRSVTVPVINCEPLLNDEFQFNSGSAASQGVSEPYYYVITKVDDLNPLAAGYNKGRLVSVLEPDSPMNWAWPKGSVQIVAEAYPNLPAIFAYSAGAAMFNGFTAPAKRGGFFVAGQNAVNLTIAGWRLLNAMVIWAAPPPPTPRVHVEKMGEYSLLDIDEFPHGWESVTIKVHNIGNAPLEFYSLDYTGPDASKFRPIRQTWSNLMQPYAFNTFEILFDPDVERYNGAGQNHYETTLKVHTNDPDTPIVEIKLTADTVPVDLSHFAAE